MKFIDRTIEWFSAPVNKALTIPQHSPETIRAEMAEDLSGASPFAVSVVYACARVIADGIAQVPCVLQKRSETGGRVAATDHPLHDLLDQAPNDFQTSFEFREMLGLHLTLTNNAYVWIIRDTLGRPIELLPLLPNMVTPVQPEPGKVAYRVGMKGGKELLLGSDTIWHLKGPSWDGVVGLSAVKVAANAIGLARDAEKFGSQLFKNGTRPSGILTTDKALSDEQFNRLKAAMAEQYSGVSNAHKLMLLDAGLVFQSVQTSANEAQFIEARRFQIEEICRVMRVNPIMVQQQIGSASYASVEQMFLAHATHTIAPWHSRFEESAEKALLSAAERKAGYRIHLDIRSMMRASANDTSTYLNSMVAGGLMTQNEAREYAGLDRINDPEADKLRPAANVFGTTPAK